MSFEEAVFGDNANFSRTKFKDYADFRKTVFRGSTSYWYTIFGEHAQFENVTFNGHAGFVGAVFGDWTAFGPVVAVNRLTLDRCSFGKAPELQIAANTLIGSKLRFLDNVLIRLRWAEAQLDRTDFTHPTVVAGVGPFSGLHEEPLLNVIQDQTWRTERPRVVSIRGSDVSNLVLSNTDLRACRFTGSYHLDLLSIEGKLPLTESPTGWYRERGWPPLWRWTSRLVLAEEHVWRARFEKGIRRRDWFPPACRLLNESVPAEHFASKSDEHKYRQEQAREVSQLYHALRKGLEDRKDEPGATDFYYGEMELRRHSLPSSFERVLLLLYWLVSGYGLRASRALATLLVVIAIGALVFAGPGFKPPPSPKCVIVDTTTVGAPVYKCRSVDRPSFREQLPEALAFSTQSATSLLHGPDRALYAAGDWTQAILRLLGPALFGLAVISLRGRVKR